MNVVTATEGAPSQERVKELTAVMLLLCEAGTKEEDR